MAFVKRHLYYVVLVAVVLVVGGASLALTLGKSGDIDEAVEQREQVFRGIQNIRRSPVNKNMVAAQELYVQVIRAEAAKVRRRLIEWNRRHYEVMELPAEDKTLPAFPIDNEMYRRHGLTYKFTQKYGKQVNALLDRLNVTSVPTQEEIDAQARRIERDIRRRLRIQQREAAAGGAATPGAEEEDGIIRNRPGGGLTGEFTVSQEAQKRAREVMRYQKARQGLMYAPPASLQNSFPVPIANAAYAELWWAQINLWVQTDIVEAIAQTNKEALRQGNQVLPPTVMNAAVKRLIGIEVAQEYYVGEATSGGSSRRPRFAEEEEEFGRPGYGASPRGGSAGAEEPGKAPTLTGHRTSPEHDVVHYSFTVVMPARHVPLLISQLMDRNLHTVRKMAYTPVDLSEQSLFHYGPNPVVTVRIDGELLMMCEWTRGWAKDPASVEPDGERWREGFPPLIPEDVLRKLPQTAQRPADLERLGTDTGTGGRGGTRGSYGNQQYMR